MNKLSRILITFLAVSLVAVPGALAQRQLGKKKGPTSKLYLAETKGKGEITNDGRTYAPKQATAFDAPGTVIETAVDSHQAFVYSNGTGMFVDQETRVEVDRFVQEPFRPDRNPNMEVEPSISQSDVFLARGMIGVCTGQLVSGSTMNYGSPHGSINIRGGKVAMQTDGDATTVFLLEGDVTVRGGTKDVAGTLLRPGEQATIRPGPPGGAPSITVGPIDRQVMESIDDKVTAACNAKKAVTFEAIEKKADEGLAASEREPLVGDAPPAPGTPASAAGAGAPTDPGAAGSDTTQEIVARPTTPAAPPTNIVVSPDRIGPGE
jgi:hypothetical protein